MIAKAKRKFGALRSTLLVALAIALASFSPFEGTRLENSGKLNSWWKEVVKTKYGNVDFSSFTFRDINSINRKTEKNLYDRCSRLLEKLPPYARNGRWLAAFDNRNQFCGLLSESRIVAQAGVKKGNEVYVNMFLNTIHLPNAQYLVDNINYYTDSRGRIIRVFCPDLKLKSRGRNQFAQKYSVKFKDGVRGDNCGHLIPQALNGPAEQINYVPQRRDLNSGEILELEKKAINAKKAGRKVSYEIRLLYNGDEKRPYGFENNVKVYDGNGKMLNNYTGIFDNNPKLKKYYDKQEKSSRKSSRQERKSNKRN